MLSRGDNLCVGGEQDVEAKALRSVRWYARRWREKLSQTWYRKRTVNHSTSELSPSSLHDGHSVPTIGTWTFIVHGNQT
jgi:hypothetical protein